MNFIAKVDAKGTLRFVKAKPPRPAPVPRAPVPNYAPGVPVTELMKDLVAVRTMAVMKAQVKGLIDEVVINGKSTKYDRRLIGLMKNIEKLSRGEYVK